MRSFAADHPIHDALSQIPRPEFVVLLANYYREQGYGVEHCQGAPDAEGADLRLRKGAQEILVQCEQVDPGLRSLLAERLDTMPTPMKLNAPEPARRAGAILVQEKLRRSRRWRKPRNPPGVLFAQGLGGLVLAAVLLFVAPAAVPKLFAALSLPLPPTTAAESVPLPLPPSS